MTDSNILNLEIMLDPWGKQPGNIGELPPDSQLVCIYDLHLGVDSLEETVCFHRASDKHELWVSTWVNDYWTRCVSVNRADSPEVSARRLFKLQVRSRTGFGWPVKFMSPGMLSEKDYRQILESLEMGFERNNETAE